MGFRSRLFICAILGLAYGTRAADLDSMRGVFDRKWGEIEKDYKAARVAAGERYATDLQIVYRHMIKTDDEYGARPTKAEIIRFRTEKTVPPESEIGTPELINAFLTSSMTEDS